MSEPVFIDARLLRDRLRHFDGYVLGRSYSDDHATNVAEAIASQVLQAIVDVCDEAIRDADDPDV